MFLLSATEPESRAVPPESQVKRVRKNEYPACNLYAAKRMYNAGLKNRLHSDDSAMCFGYLRIAIYFPFRWFYVFLTTLTAPCYCPCGIAQSPKIAAPHFFSTLLTLLLATWPPISSTGLSFLGLPTPTDLFFYPPHGSFSH